VAVDPGRGSAAQGSAVLPSLRRKRRNRICRLCLGTEPRRRHFRRPSASSSGRRDFHSGERRRLSREGGQPPLSSRRHDVRHKETPANHAGVFVGGGVHAPMDYLPAGALPAGAGAGAAAPPLLASSLPRSSAAFFSMSSWSFFCRSSRTFGSIAGPSKALRSWPAAKRRSLRY